MNKEKIIKGKNKKGHGNPECRLKHLIKSSYYSLSLLGAHRVWGLRFKLQGIFITRTHENTQIHTFQMGLHPNPIQRREPSQVMLVSLNF